ncbi:MAG: dTDP-4-dehydrorhamnose 3,5-epimerase family protein [Armatimonadetes bacterium]|nr:dTDP-4-dehydrorhamnose 3,5-epimerase family protein [Armatimonadota bacterium]
MIEGVLVKPLKPIPDDRGRLMEIMRSDDEHFERFGQVYMTTTYPGVVKAWHMHRLQHDHMCAVHGMFRVALYDAREGSPTRGEVQDVYMGIHKPVVVRIPPGVYHGWVCVSEYEGIVVNIPDLPYNHEQPDEYRLPFDTTEIPYDWSRKMG